ncbi:hypothetical protein [Desulfosporosinus sp.]|uniref:hypothetical protein n=1 Tax=Desulfosporosinus sp. TaxID=157907 RepID=UPI002316FFE2|nr:hypothetical protein [Desulfosporosinus sp.]MCO5385214.1 hypothetical protein [Desulfosporosinus sp.]MDA8222921.1 hypothetical protein [Desulfitobacterium hafniense]
MQFTMRAVRVSCGYAEDEVARYCGVSYITYHRQTNPIRLGLVIKEGRGYRVPMI